MNRGKKEFINVRVKLTLYKRFKFIQMFKNKGKKLKEKNRFS